MSAILRHGLTSTNYLLKAALTGFIIIPYRFLFILEVSLCQMKRFQKEVGDRCRSRGVRM